MAKKIIELVPSIEKVRMVNSGTEATMSAIRLARGYTSRNLILKFSGDDFMTIGGSVSISPPVGLPRLAQPIRINNAKIENLS